MKLFTRIYSACRWVSSVVGSAVYRFYWDDCFSRAAALSYTTLFALVPGIYLLINILGALGVAESQGQEAIRGFLQQVLPPGSNEQLLELQGQIFLYLGKFQANVRALKSISIAILMFTSISLINSIESALNVIWRVTSSSSIVTKITSYAGVLVLGGVFFALWLYFSPIVGQMASTTEVGGVVYSSFNEFIVPVMVVWLGLVLMFYKLPSAKIGLPAAAFGGFVGALLFEAVKWGFAAFVGASSTYSTTYGLLASIPLFLFWMYLAWCVVLLGAEVAYQAGSIHILRGLRKYATELGEVGTLLGLRILYCIAVNFYQGKTPPSESEVALDVGSDPVLVRTCLDVLTEANLLSPADAAHHRRALLISPSKLSIADIVATFRSDEHQHLLRLTDPAEMYKDDLMFLHLLRSTSERLAGHKGLEDWTLRDLFESAEQVAC